MPCVLLEERKISAVHLYKLRPSASLNGVERNSLTHIASPQCCTVYTHTQNRCKQHFLMDPHFFPITKSLHLLQSQSAEQLKHPYAAHCCFLPQINLPGAANKPETMEQRCITFFPDATPKSFCGELHHFAASVSQLFKLNYLWDSESFIFLSKQHLRVSTKSSASRAQGSSYRSSWNKSSFTAGGALYSPCPTTV